MLNSVSKNGHSFDDVKKYLVKRESSGQPQLNEP